MSDLQALAKAWQLFQIGSDNPISLRAIDPSKRKHARNVTFTAAEYPDVRDREDAASFSANYLNNSGYNLYTLLNPIVPSFTGSETPAGAVSDQDIACRRLLLVDLDRSGLSDDPATDDEIRLAWAVADEITSFLMSKFSEPPVRVMSGNGIHLYQRLADLPNDDRSKACCQSLLIGLAGKFNTSTIKVDTSVYNASRITKLPGTIARKGVDSTERPFRMAQFA